MNFDSLFVNPNGRTSRGEFVPAMLTLLAAVAFYAILVQGRSGRFSLLVLLWPGIVLTARRLQDMGRTAWLLLVPGLLLLAMFAVWLKYLSFGAQVDSTLPIVAIAVSALFVAWGLVGGSRQPLARA